MTEQDRIAALEERVAALERAIGTATPSPAAPSTAAPAAGSGTEPAAETGGGTVGYGGEVTLHGTVTWRIDLDAGATASLPPDTVAGVLAALGHPARVALVQELVRGPRTAADLREIVDTGSKGQLYHHLTALTAAGIVAKQARGSYEIAAPRVVPALIAILAAADIGGLLR